MFQALLSMLRVRVRFADGDPASWARAWRRYAPWCVLIAPAYFLGPLTRLPDALAVLRFSYDPLVAAVCYAALLIVVVPLLLAAVGIYARRAVGVLFFGAAFVHGVPMVSAWVIAAVAMDSGAMAVATTGLILWVLWRLRHAVGQVDESSLMAIADQRLVVQEQEPRWLPDTALGDDDEVQALRARVRGPVSGVAEFGAIVVAMGLALAAYVRSAGASFDFLLVFLWLLMLVMILGSRGLALSTVLQWRAMALACGRQAAERRRHD